MGEAEADAEMLATADCGVLACAKAAFLVGLLELAAAEVTLLGEVGGLGGSEAGGELGL